MGGGRIAVTLYTKNFLLRHVHNLLAGDRDKYDLYILIIKQLKHIQILRSFCKSKKLDFLPLKSPHNWSAGNTRCFLQLRNGLMDTDDCFDYEFNEVDILVRGKRKSKKYFPKGWLVCWPELMLYLFNDLTKNEIRVFMAIAAHTERLNKTSVTRKRLAAWLDMQKNHIDTAVKKLKEKHAILETEQKTLQIHPRLMWFGNTDQYHEAWDELETLNKN